MLLKHLFGLFCVAVFCMTANADEEFMLAYYVEVRKQDSKYVFQQHGQRLSSDSRISTPVGRGGRSEFILSLASLGEKTGVLRLELFDDTSGANAVITPAYSLDVEFSIEGAKGEVVDTKGDRTVELSYAIVPKLNL